jgi:hypothetical protein
MHLLASVLVRMADFLGHYHSQVSTPVDIKTTEQPGNAEPEQANVGGSKQSNIFSGTFFTGGGKQFNGNEFSSNGGTMNF